MKTKLILTIISLLLSACSGGSKSSGYVPPPDELKDARIHIDLEGFNQDGANALMGMFDKPLFENGSGNWSKLSETDWLLTVDSVDKVTEKKNQLKLVFTKLPSTTEMVYEDGDLSKKPTPREKKEVKLSRWVVNGQDLDQTALATQFAEVKARGLAIHRDEFSKASKKLIADVHTNWVNATVAKAKDASGPTPAPEFCSSTLRTSDSQDIYHMGGLMFTLAPLIDNGGATWSKASENEWSFTGELLDESTGTKTKVEMMLELTQEISKRSEERVTRLKRLALNGKEVSPESLSTEHDKIYKAGKERADAWHKRFQK